MWSIRLPVLVPVPRNKTRPLSEVSGAPHPPELVRARKRALHGDRRSLSVCRYVLASLSDLSVYSLYRSLSVRKRVCVAIRSYKSTSRKTRAGPGDSLAIPFQPQRPREACGTVHPRWGPSALATRLEGRAARN